MNSLQELLDALEACEPITDELRQELRAGGMPDHAITQAQVAGYLYCRPRRSFMQFDLSDCPPDLLPSRFRDRL